MEHLQEGRGANRDSQNSPKMSASVLKRNHECLQSDAEWAKTPIVINIHFRKNKTTQLKEEEKIINKKRAKALDSFLLFFSDVNSQNYQKFHVFE